MQSVTPLKKENNHTDILKWTCFTTKYDVITLFYFNNPFHVEETEIGWSLWSIVHTWGKTNSYDHNCVALNWQWSRTNTSAAAHDLHTTRSRTQLHCSPTLKTFSFASVGKPMLQVSFQPLYLYAKRSLIQKLGNQQNPVQSNALHPERERELETDAQKKLQHIPLSNDVIYSRIHEMSQNILQQIK